MIEGVSSGGTAKGIDLFLHFTFDCNSSNLQDTLQLL